MSESVSWSRAEPMSLIPAARAMYEQGYARSDVLTAIYGVDLPAEALLVLRDFVIDAKPLGVSWRITPWELMVRPENRDPEMDLGPHECDEDARAYAQAPHIVLIGRLEYHGVELGSSLIGYDLDELRAGRSTIVGLKNVPRLPASPVTFTVFGPSLLEVLHELVASYLALAKRRFESDHHEDVDSVVEQLDSIEILQRELREASKSP